VEITGVFEISNSCIDIEDLTAPELRELLSYWESLRGGRFAPSWTDVELIDMPAKLLPYLAVVEVHPAPLDFVYAFYGTGHMALKARDLTGRSIMETRPDENMPIVFEQYRRTLEARKPLAFRRTVAGAAAGKNGNPTQNSLRLPLSADGEGVHWIMSLSDLRDSPAMRDFYETYGRHRPFRQAAAISRAGAG
tara:strand:- start:90 stop:668 length:579 start_codon:yes stop_codon:yes gene_type:complete